MVKIVVRTSPLRLSLTLALSCSGNAVRCERARAPVAPWGHTKKTISAFVFFVPTNVELRARTPAVASLRSESVGRHMATTPGTRGLDSRTQRWAKTRRPPGWAQINGNEIKFNFGLTLVLVASPPAPPRGCNCTARRGWCHIYAPSDDRVSVHPLALAQNG